MTTKKPKAKPRAPRAPRLQDGWYAAVANTVNHVVGKLGVPALDAVSLLVQAAYITDTLNVSDGYPSRFELAVADVRATAKRGPQ